MAKRRRHKWLKIVISKKADKYIKSLARRVGVTPSKVMSLVIVMELDRLDRLDAKKKRS